jgi:hypothetical protein
MSPDSPCESSADFVQQGLASLIGAFTVANSPHVATAELLHMSAQPFG